MRMTSALYTTGLLLSLEAGPTEYLGDIPLWRNGSRYIAHRELSCARFAGNGPSSDQARHLLDETFAAGSPVTAAGPSPGQRLSSRAMDPTGVACLIAEIALLPDMRPVPPGGEFPIVGQVVGPAMLVDVVPWPHEASSAGERAAAAALLHQAVSALPRDVWQDGA